MKRIEDIEFGMWCCYSVVLYIHEVHPVDSNIEMMHVAHERGWACFGVTSRNDHIGHSGLNHMLQERRSALRLGAKRLDTDVVAPRHLRMTVMDVGSSTSAIHNRNAPTAPLCVQTHRGCSIDA